jgi:hypothetical protein
MIDRDSVLEWAEASRYAQMSLEAETEQDREFFEDWALGFASRATDRERSKQDHGLLSETGS